MVQDKNIQLMMIQERFNRMDILTYGNEMERKGIEEGERKIVDLVAKLYSSGRRDEVEKMACDRQYRKALLKEFQID